MRRWLAIVLGMTVGLGALVLTILLLAPRIPLITISLYAGASHLTGINCRGQEYGLILPRDGEKDDAIFVDISGLTVDPLTGDVYVVDTSSGEVRVIRSTGKTETLAGSWYDQDKGCRFRDGTGQHARFCWPFRIAFDDRRRVLYLIDYGNLAIRQITLSGRVTTILGPSKADIKSLPDYSYQVECTSTGSRGVTRLCSPTGITVDPASGEIMVADAGTDQLLDITGAGEARPIAGSGAPCGVTLARLRSAEYDAVSDTIVISAGRGLQRIGRDGCIIENIGIKYSLTRDAYEVTDVGNAGCRDFDGIGEIAAFCGPQDVAIDPRTGAILIADTGNAELRRYWRGYTQTLAGQYRWGNPYGYCYGEPRVSQTGPICFPVVLAFDSKRRLLYFGGGTSGQVWKVSGL